VPLFVLLVFEFANEYSNLRMASYLSLVAGMLAALAFLQQPLALVIACALLLIACFGEYLLIQLEMTRKELADKDEQLQSQESKLKNQRMIITTVEQQGRAAERRRLATRIHDQVGHGMTGSILILEAAQVQLASDPEAARLNIEKATENLRESVDRIRSDLREERVSTGQVGLAQIQDALKDFGAVHPQITTTLAVEGVLDQMPQAAWTCIHENLLETLTNLLKHSSADRFEVQISQRNLLVTVRFGDNGGAQRVALEPALATDAPAIERGIGLVGIEERCALIGGHAFFSRTARGFVTRMTFSLKGSPQ
jgi:signal transduction histidine kinase